MLLQIGRSSAPSLYLTAERLPRAIKLSLKLSDPILLDATPRGFSVVADARSSSQVTTNCVPMTRGNRLQEIAYVMLGCAFGGR
jgi:hypothetical protein